MNRSDAKHIVNNGYDSHAYVQTVSAVQAAESLNEIAQFTLRDRFAVAAMNAMIQQPYTLDTLVKQAYIYADAMLKARSE